MAFRRQDIPKTTRKGDDGRLRRLYPRFAKDRTQLPKIELAIGYLDGMVGRRRGDLTPDIVLELFGDPKLARCMLASLADTYRYRIPEFADVIGDAAARDLAAWNLLTPIDLRGHAYLAANDRFGGFVSDTDRPAFLDALAAPLGLEPRQVDELLHLDAERNAVLIRVGDRPWADDVLARYNALLTLSTLRHASAVELVLPGLDAATIATVCTRQEVVSRGIGPDIVCLSGRRNALGSWSGFGARVARCALQLVLLAPGTPTGRATVHLGDQSLDFVLDGPAVAALRPKRRLGAGTDGVVRAALLMDGVATLRRQAGGGGTNGWTMRRATEPLVADGALVLPEIVFTRDEATIAVAPVPPGAGRDAALTALAEINRVRPTIALGADLADLPCLPSTDAAALMALLDRIADRTGAGTSPLGILREEIAAAGWIPVPRLIDLLGGADDLTGRLLPLTADGDAAMVPGFGLCRVALLDDLLDRLPAGPLDVAAVRATVSVRVGDGPGADALTLHLLGRHAVVARPADRAA